MTVVSTNELAIRAIGDRGEIDGYIAVWGSPDQRDSYDTWFDPNQPPDLGLKDGEFLPVRLMYDHGEDGGIQKEIVGKITKVWRDNIGIRFYGLLDRTSSYFERVVDEIKQGLLRISSGSAPHLADFDSDGRFVRWYLTEVSLTPTPAEPRMPTVALIRSANGMQLSVEIAGDEAIGGRPAAAPHESETTATRKPNDTKGSKRAMLNLEQLGVAPTATLEEVFKALVDMFGDPDIALAMATKMLKGSAAPAADAPEDGAPQEMMAADAGRSKKIVKPAAPNADAPVTRADIEAAIKAAMATPPAPEPKEVRSQQPQPQIEVSEPRKYWGRSLDDLMFAYEVNKARGNRASEEFVRVIAGRTAKAIEKQSDLVVNPAVRSLLGKATRADEIVTSTNTGNGDEFIGVAYSGMLWEKARNTRIYQLLVAKGMRVEEVPQGMESTVIFTEGSDPTVYTITQSTDLDATLRPTVVVPVTAPGTGQVTLTPGYLGMAVAYTSVFEEDSLINASTQFNRQMQEKAEETIEQLFLNGDTASTLNVNYDGGTANAAQYFLASNGARKYALVTGSGTSRDGGALDENDYRLTLKLFPSAIRTRKSQMAFIIDSDTHNTSLNIPAIKTDDVRRTNATIESGQLTNIYGVDVFESGFMPLTDTDGKVTYNAAGTLGTILGVYAPFWAMGWKRRVTFETSKDILAQSNLIVATFRLGFLARGAGASVASYSLTIA